MQSACPRLESPMPAHTACCFSVPGNTQLQTEVPTSYRCLHSAQQQLCFGVELPSLIPPQKSQTHPPQRRGSGEKVRSLQRETLDRQGDVGEEYGLVVVSWLPRAHSSCVSLRKLWSKKDSAHETSDRSQLPVVKPGLV